MGRSFDWVNIRLSRFGTNTNMLMACVATLARCSTQCMKCCPAVAAAAQGVLLARKSLWRPWVVHRVVAAAIPRSRSLCSYQQRRRTPRVTELELAIAASLQGVETRVSSQRERLAELEQEVADPELWNDSSRGQAVMTEHAALASAASDLQQCSTLLQELMELYGNQDWTLALAHPP